MENSYVSGRRLGQEGHSQGQAEPPLSTGEADGLTPENVQQPGFLLSLRLKNVQLLVSLLLSSSGSEPIFPPLLSFAECSGDIK